MIVKEPQNSQDFIIQQVKGTLVPLITDETSHIKPVTSRNFQWPAMSFLLFQSRMHFSIVS